MRYWIACVGVVLCLPGVEALGQAQSVALVVGVGHFQNNPSKHFSCANDAACVSRRLRLGGFVPDNITTLVDPKYTAMREALEETARRARGADLLLFYYSGQEAVSGGEFLLMSHDGQWGEVGTDNIPDGKENNLPLAQVTRILEASGAATIFVILDTCHCRLSWEPPALRKNRFILAAAGPEHEAMDNGTHGVFTQHLLTALNSAADTDGDGEITIIELARTVLHTCASARDCRPRFFGACDSDPVLMKVQRLERSCPHSSSGPSTALDSANMAAQE